MLGNDFTFNHPEVQAYQPKAEPVLRLSVPGIVTGLRNSDLSSPKKEVMSSIASSVLSDAEQSPRRGENIDLKGQRVNLTRKDTSMKVSQQ